MLMQMRKGAGSWIAKIFLAAVALSFVAWGIGDVFRGNSASTVADVGDKEVSYDQLYFAYTEQTRGLTQQGINVEQGSELANVLVEVVLNDLIDQALYDQEASSYGITVGKETIAAAIAANPAFQDQSGQFSAQIFPIALANLGMSEQQYIASLTRQLTSAQLLDSITTAPPLPDTLVNTLYKFRNEKRTAEIVVVPNTLFAEVVEPSETDLATFFEAHAADYRAPEYRSADYLTIYPEDLAADIVVSDADLQEAYDATAGRWVTPETRTLQQIVFENENQALTAYDRLVNGDDFLAVAADAGRDANTANLGQFTRDEMLPELADKVFALDAGAFTEPIQSPFGGWLIFRVSDITPGTTISFEEAKPELQDMVALERAHDTMFDLANELDDMIVAGDSLRQAALSLGLEVKTINGIDAEGELEDPASLQVVPSEPEFLAELFQGDVNFPTPVVETDAGGLLTVEVTAIEDEHMRDLDEVRDQIIADWQASELAKAAAQRAREIADGVDANVALPALEELNGYRDSGTETLLRSDTPKIPGSDLNLVAALFKVDPGDIVVVPSSDGTAQVIARLVSVEPANPSANPDALSALTASVASGNRSAISDEHIAYLRQAYDIIINHELIAQRF